MLPRFLSLYKNLKKCTFRHSKVLQVPSCYTQNSHFFAGGGPSIVSLMLGKKRQPSQTPKLANSNRQTVTFERTETNSTITSISEIPVKKNVEPSIAIAEQKPKKNLKISNPEHVIDYQDNCVYEKPQKQEVEKKLSPATLGAMLDAELDHYIKVETEIGQVAEVVGNVQAAEHEQKAAENIVYDNDDDSKEMQELEYLDNEIARLENILNQKLALKAKQDEEYYSSEYYSDYDE